MKDSPALPLQQHASFGAALGLLGRRVERLDLPCAAPVQTISRFGLRFVPRGPVWRDPEKADARALRALRIHIINSESDQTPLLRAAGYRQIMTTAHVAELSLDTDASTRIARAHGKWRNVWRRATRAAFKIKAETFAPDLHQWVLDADLAQQRDKGYRALPHDLLRAYVMLHPAAAILFVARIKRDPIAAMLFLTHAPVVTYHIGWSNSDGRRLGAHHALLMRAADHFAERGFTRLDLGTVDTENAPGLARFKIGSGARIRALGGTWLRMPFG